MRALSSLLQHLLGQDEDDQLAGAVDLSDADYCFALLSRNQAEENAPFFPAQVEAGAQAR